MKGSSDVWRSVFLVAVVAVVFGGYIFFQNSPLQEVKALENDEWTFAEYTEYFEDIAEERGAPYAYRVLREAVLTPGTDLHLLGHVVGDVLYDQQGIEGIHECTPEFRNACSHSVVIGLFNERGVEALSDISAACRNAPGGSGAYTMCFHGLGHGVLAYNLYDYEKAISMCKKTGTAEYNNREYIECVGGATMEIIAGVHDRASWEIAHEKYFKDDEPLYPCTADFMPEEARPICLTYLTPHLFESAGLDLGNPLPSGYDEAFAQCSELPEDAFLEREACYGGFGKEFIVLVKERDIRNVDVFSTEELQTIHSWCELADNQAGIHACKGHALASLFWGGENDPQVSVDFCAVAGIEADSCFAQLATHIQYYFPQGLEKDSLCRLLPEPHSVRCARL